MKMKTFSLIDLSVLTKGEGDSKTSVWILKLQASPNKKGVFENKFTSNLTKEINDALDYVLSNSNDSNSALVLTSEGKFFSNGHDISALEYAVREEEKLKGKEKINGPASTFIREFYQLLARFMVLPIFTVAAINGHAFAGGCLLAMAQDVRVMRADRGFICMNEIDMALFAPKLKPGEAESPIKPGLFKDADMKMMSVLLAKLPIAFVREVMLTGKRYNGVEAANISRFGASLVDAAIDGEENTLNKAIEMATELAKKSPPRNRRTVSVLKYELVRQYLPALTEGVDPRRSQMSSSL